MSLDFITDHLGKRGTHALATLLLILAILLITWLARRVVAALLPRVIRRVGRWARPGLTDQIIRIIQPPLHFVITLLGMWLVLIVLELPYGISSAVNRVMASLIAIAIFWTAYRAVDLVIGALQAMIRRSITGEPATLLDEKLALALQQVIKALIIIFAFVAVMEQWGYSVGGLMAGLGLGGLAFALAAQDALANLIGYFVILADEPFRVGEYIVVGEVAGTVEQTGFRSTRVRVLDQSLVTIPNKTMANANITNWSRLAKRRLNMTLGITYGSSPQQVLAVVQAIREMLTQHDLVQDDSVVVQFVAFNESSLDLMIICFMRTPAWGDFQAARQDINLKIMDILQQHGVSVAFPTHTVVIDQGIAEEAAAAPPLPGPEPTKATATDSPVPDDAAN